ncbi:MAG: YabP/YqfC family sporulation protein [Alicyclobacillaceae bacterium]|nr:YabP/YqfC family sporulation protein [Alicyclobacillaceae bacterium]
MRAWKRRLQRAAAEMFALPPDALADVCRVTCTDGAELVVENVTAIRRVSDTRIEVDCGRFTLAVEGESFEVTYISGREMHVQGQVAAICYQRRGGAAL